MENIFEIGLHKPLGQRGGPGQYCLINVSTVWNGGTGAHNEIDLKVAQNNAAMINRYGTQGDNFQVSLVKGANRGLTDKGAAAQFVTACALPMPTNVRFNYGADWSADGTGLTERSIGLARDMILGNQTWTDLSGGFTGAIANVKGQIANELVKMAGSTAFRKATKDQGYAYDPHKELFYNGPQFRSFSFDWRFNFENKRDADQFNLMVAKLAEHMSPDFLQDASSGVWKIPDTFYIEFVNANTRKIGACVLLDLDVDYTTSGAGWKAHDDGNPAHVSLSMKLMEMAPLTKNDIKAGR